MGVVLWGGGEGRGGEGRSVTRRDSRKRAKVVHSCGIVPCITPVIFNQGGADVLG